MADTSLFIKDASGDLVPVDVRKTAEDNRRQVVLLGDGTTANLISPATEATLAAILTELGQKLEAGQSIALDGPTLAALETIQANTGLDLSPLAKDATLSSAVGGPGSSPPSLANSGTGLLGYLRNILDALRGTLAVGGTVAVSSVPEVEVKNDAGNPLAASVAALTDGTAQVKFVAPAGATPGNVAASVASVTLAAANATRRGLYVYNDSTANLFLKLGATASATSFTVKIPAGGLYELPVPFYRGVVDGIWDAANGNARVTELT